jgi:hypothetical protein
MKDLDESNALYTKKPADYQQASCVISIPINFQELSELFVALLDWRGCW